ncbi:MAG: DedA family protein [Prevotellaceae bacterium]|jgi:membrane protein YqaA with SNARE-associated domain|nr:DedA family protein [Prevotellaceae bacterium]
MELILQLGYLGLFIGAFLASTLIPLSSDIIYAGILLVFKANPWIALIIVTLGNWLGGLTSYGLGYLGKWKWIEKIFKVKPEQLEKQKNMINKYGALLAFFTWLPLVGDIMSLALGFYRINPKICMSFSLIGRFLRFLVWTLLFLKYGEMFINCLGIKQF